MNGDIRTSIGGEILVRKSLAFGMGIRGNAVCRDVTDTFA